MSGEALPPRLILGHSRSRPSDRPLMATMQSATASSPAKAGRSPQSANHTFLVAIGRSTRYEPSPRFRMRDGGELLCKNTPPSLKMRAGTAAGSSARTVNPLAGDPRLKFDSSPAHCPFW